MPRRPSPNLRWKILQTEPAVELAHVDHLPLGPTCTAAASGASALEQFPHGDAEGQLVDSRPGAVTADAEQFGAGALPVPKPPKPGTAPVHDAGDATEGLHIVDHCRKAEITRFHRKGAGSWAHRAPFTGAYQRTLSPQM